MSQIAKKQLSGKSENHNYEHYPCSPFIGVNMIMGMIMMRAVHNLTFKKTKIDFKEKNTDFC